MTLEPTESGTPAGAVSSDNTGTLPSEGSGGLLDNGNGGTQPLSIDEYEALPKSWQREQEANWKPLPKNVREYIYKRESDVERGIRSYADGHGRWSKATEPFQQIFAQHPDLDQVALFQGLAQNHIALQQAEPAERRALFQRMAQHYGIDFAEAAAGAAGAQVAEGLTPAMQAELQRMLEPVMRKVDQNSTFVEGERQKEIKSKVDTFWSDPQNTYINEVADDVVQILKTGVTRDLKEAYDLAVMRNPAVKAKYLQDLATKAGSASRSAPNLNLRSSTAPASPGKVGTMEQTIDGIIHKHYGSKK